MKSTMFASWEFVFLGISWRCKLRRSSCSRLEDLGLRSMGFIGSRPRGVDEKALNLSSSPSVAGANAATPASTGTPA